MTAEANAPSLLQLADREIHSYEKTRRAISRAGPVARVLIRLRLGLLTWAVVRWASRRTARLNAQAAWFKQGQAALYADKTGPSLDPDWLMVDRLCSLELEVRATAHEVRSLATEMAAGGSSSDRNAGKAMEKLAQAADALSIELRYFRAELQSYEADRDEPGRPCYTVEEVDQFFAELGW